MTTDRKAGHTADETLTEEQLVAIMRSPKYWKHRDPATLAKVTEGFKRLYPDNPAQPKP